jgi:L-fuconolactonase
LHLVDHHLDLEFEFDHCGKPRLATGEIATWQCDIALLAEHPNIVCKLSGLLTEAAPDWQIADLRRRWIMLLRASGRSACCGETIGGQSGGGYAKWFAAAETLLADLSSDEKADIFGGKPARVYLASRGRRTS